MNVKGLFSMNDRFKGQMGHLFAVFVTIVVLVGCNYGRYIIYNFADIRDYKKFQSRELKSGESIFRFSETTNARTPKKVVFDGKEEMSFDDYLEQNKTVAFLMIKNDTIVYERYFKGYDEESIVPSFSMAKSVTSILIGCAIDDGYIQSVDDTITKYIPELIPNGLGKVTIKNLLQMTSGIRLNESYNNPFGDAAAFYYGRNLRRDMMKMEMQYEPGEHFEYASGNTQLLGWILERVLKNKSITQYLQERLWTPLGMEHDASWSLDKKMQGLEKTFCCINARIRDYAKIGRLYLNGGNWNGKQIVSQDWVEQSTKVETTDGSRWYYQYQWWLPTQSGDYMALGLLGQHIYVNPSKKMIIVRLGKKAGDVDWWKLYPELAAQYE